ncbi:hypothetical protein BBJ28_00021729 [Nothophytophthora sp. Chile5]|nr:hypothetical protein BBJ28_00021729 [Nothophytophthora sp. Chile5]
MAPPPLPKLSSFLRPPSSFSESATASSIEAATTSSDTIATSAGFQTTTRAGSPSAFPRDRLHKRKQALLETEASDERAEAAVAPFSRLDSVFQADDRRVSQRSAASASERARALPRSSPQAGYASNMQSLGDYATEQAHPSPLQRERTSRYLNEGERREIITRIEGGEKQVTLAKEYSVSRAAICNLYKNRWEVLTRGGRDPEAKHPKRPRSKKPGPRRTQSLPVPIAAASPPMDVATATTAFPDVSMVPIQTEKSPRAGGRELYLPRQDDNQWSGVAVDSFQSQPQYHHHQENGHPTPPQEAVKGPASPKAFAVHEASAYSPACRNLISTLRNMGTSAAVFQQRATRLMRLLMEETLARLPQQDVEATTPYGDVCRVTKSMDDRDICAISMEENGLVLLRAFSEISPASPTGVVSIETDPISDSSNRQLRIHAQLPPIELPRVVLLLDAQCATGEEACAVLSHLVHDKHVSASSVYFVTAISSLQGLQKVHQHFPGTAVAQDASLMTWPPNSVFADCSALLLSL